MQITHSRGKFSIKQTSLNYRKNQRQK